MDRLWQTLVEALRGKARECQAFRGPDQRSVIWMGFTKGRCRVWVETQSCWRGLGWEQGVLQKVGRQPPAHPRLLRLFPSLSFLWAAPLILSIHLFAGLCGSGWLPRTLSPATAEAHTFFSPHTRSADRLTLLILYPSPSFRARENTMLPFVHLCLYLSALGAAFAATAEQWKSRSIYQ